MHSSASVLKSALQKGQKINLLETANAMGAKVSYSDDFISNRSGMIAYDEGRYIITLSEDLKGKDRDFVHNFTLAHEMAHLALHQDLLLRGGIPHLDTLFLEGKINPPAPFTVKHENEAINLGSEILAPHSVLLRHLRENDGQFDDALVQSACEELDLPADFVRAKIDATREALQTSLNEQ